VQSWGGCRDSGLGLSGLGWVGCGEWVGVYGCDVLCWLLLPTWHLGLLSLQLGIEDCVVVLVFLRIVCTCSWSLLGPFGCN